MKLRILTDADLGKCVEDVIVIPQPLYVVDEYNDYIVDDYDDLLWDIPQSDCQNVSCETYDTLEIVSMCRLTYAEKPV